MASKKAPSVEELRAKKVSRIEKIAQGDLGGGHIPTLKRIRHWQRRIWKESDR